MQQCGGGIIRRLKQEVATLAEPNHTHDWSVRMAVENITPLEKVCTLCEKTKPLNGFYKDKGGLWGRASTCINCVRLRAKKRYASNLSRSREYVNHKQRERRTKVLKVYGEFCQCCGETQYEFLGIDHIDGGGQEHRRSNQISNIDRWLKKNNYPPGFQVLCHNCNLAKGLYGECPHQRIRLIGLGVA